MQMMSGFGFTSSVIGQKVTHLCTFGILNFCHHTDAGIFHFALFLWTRITKHFMEMTLKKYR